MTLEIHFDQLQNCINTFHTADNALADAQSLPLTHTSDGEDALAAHHEDALGALSSLLDAAGSDFSQVHTAAQNIFDGFKAADAAGA